MNGLERFDGGDATGLRTDEMESNVEAALALTELVRTTFGPGGMDKMLVNSYETVTITNDARRVLNELRIEFDLENPVARLFAHIAETQYEQAGEGCTTAVLLAGELLSEASALLDRGVHPNAIIAGFESACDLALREIDDIAVDTSTLPRDTYERAIAETSMTGTVVSDERELLSDLVVRAVRNVTVGSTVDLKYLTRETTVGRPIRQSSVLHGALLSKAPIGDDVPHEIDDASIALIHNSIGMSEPAADVGVDVRDPDELDTVRGLKERQLADEIRQLEAATVDLVICQRGIDTDARRYLERAGLVGVEHVKGMDMEFLNVLLDASIVPSPKHVTTDGLGRAAVRYDGDEEALYIEPPDGHGVTQLLYGTTDNVVSEVDRCVKKANDAVARAVSSGRVTAGGGALEMEVAHRINDQASTMGDRTDLAVEAFATALEAVVRTLIENGGYDPIENLAELTARHDGGDQHTGIDLTTGELGNTIDRGIIEPPYVKKHALSIATEVVTFLLKVDTVIYLDET